MRLRTSRPLAAERGSTEREVLRSWLPSGHPGLIEALYRGAITGDEAASLIAHAVGRHQARRQRFALALEVSPDEALACGRGDGSTCRGGRRVVTLARPEWRLRCAVGVVCVVQSVVEGRAVYA